MADTDATAEAIRRHMQAIRKDLRNNVSDVVSGANELLDWKSYVRRHPWLIMGGAAALGYMLVPRRSRELEAVTAAQESLNTLAHEVRAQSTPQPAPSMLGTLGPIVGGMLLRAGTTYGINLLGQLMNSVLDKSAPRTEEHRPSPAGPDSFPVGRAGNGRGKGHA